MVAKEPNGNTPVMCTLTTKQAAAQTLEWQDLQGKLLDAVPIDGGARLSFPAELADQVEDLAKREAACCAFLKLAVIRRGDATPAQLEVTSENPDGIPVISLLAGIPLP